MELAAIEALYPAHVRHLEAVYARALAEAGYDAVVIHSGVPQKKVSYDDQYWSLRPTPFFQHWVALYEASCFVVVQPGIQTRLFWPEAHDFWERPAPPESTAFTGTLDVVRSSKVELPAGKVAFLGDDAGAAAALGLGSAQNPPALVTALDRLRVLKTEYEVAALAEANRRASLGHEAVKRAFLDGKSSELDLHLLYLKATSQDDPETPYKNIVATGRNASILHHVSYGRDVTKAESLLLDAGATCLGYCSDITRTWVKHGGAASKAFTSLLAAMEAMQLRLTERIQVGAPYEELHDESHRQVSAILKESGLVRGSVDEIDGKGISRVFYPHGLGHALGLQVHDVGCGLIKPKSENPFLRNTSRIEEGQVFTIEPGLYFIDSLLDDLRSKPESTMVDWNMIEALAPLGGIRIEDDVLVTGATPRNFTREVLPVGGGAV